MTIENIKKEFKHSNCDELNEELDKLLSEFYFESEGLTEAFYDVVLDYKNQKEKEWSELYDEPQDWLESILIKTRRDMLDEVIDKLTMILYTEKPKRQPNMNAKQSREWLNNKVKPLIREGYTKQKDVAKKLKIDDATVISKRTKRAYNCDWYAYVESIA